MKIYPGKRCMMSLVSAAVLLFQAGTGAVASTEDQNNRQKEQASTQSTEKIYVATADIRDLISNFARRQGLRYRMTKGVKGKVETSWFSNNTEVFFSELANKYDLQWYRDGNTIQVSHLSENVSRIIPLYPVPFSIFQERLKELELLVSDFPIRHSEESRQVLLSGPPSYIARLEIIAEGMQNTLGTVSIIKFGKREKINF